MTDQQKAGAAQDGSAGSRLRCGLQSDERQLVVNGIRFVRVDGDLLSEELAPEHAEQAERLCRLPEYERIAVTKAQASRIDALVRSSVAAERVSPSATTGAAVTLERQLAEQQRINMAVSEERDNLREQVREMEAKLASNDVAQLKADLEAKAEVVANLKQDVERLQGEVTTVTQERNQLKDDLRVATDSNEALAKAKELVEAQLTEVTTKLAAAADKGKGKN